MGPLVMVVKRIEEREVEKLRNGYGYGYVGWVEKREATISGEMLTSDS